MFEYNSVRAMIHLYKTSLLKTLTGNLTKHDIRTIYKHFKISSLSTCNPAELVTFDLKLR